MGAIWLAEGWRCDIVGSVFGSHGMIYWYLATGLGGANRRAWIGEDLIQGCDDSDLGNDWHGFYLVCEHLTAVSLFCVE